MIKLLNEYAPSAGTVVSSIMSDQDQIILQKQSPNAWTSLMKSLASTSPVCALLHPSDSVAKLVSSIKEKNITKDAILMQKLQQEIPVIFALIRSLAYYPQKILTPLLEDLWIKAKAPFNLEYCVDKPEDEYACVENGACRMEEFSYFSGLPKIHSRGIYVADKKFNDTICTKRSSRHPALLPGIFFTLFCEHGNCVFWFWVP